MAGVQWYDATEEGQERLLAAWEDAPIEDLESLGLILTTAKDQVIAYAPALPAEGDGEAPDVYTETSPLGVQLTLAPAGALVSMTLAVPEVLSPWSDLELLTIPEDYQADVLFSFASPDGNVSANVKEGDPSVLQVGTNPTDAYTLTGAWTPAVAFGTIPVYPERYALAQLNMARDLWNAGRTDASGSIGGEGFFYKPLSLSKESMRIIRPVRGGPGVY